MPSDKSQFTDPQRRADTLRQLKGKSQVHGAGQLDDKDLMPGVMPPANGGKGGSGVPPALVVAIGKGKPGGDADSSTVPPEKGDQMPPEMTDATAGDAGMGKGDQPPATIESLSQQVADLTDMVKQLVGGGAPAGGDGGGAGDMGTAL